MRRRVIGSIAIASALAMVSMAVGPARSAAAATTATPTQQYYVSLGDSLAQGVQPGFPAGTNQGYADDLYAITKLRYSHLNLVKLGCPGETTTTMIHGGICPYTAGSQLAAAEAFLSTHKIAFVTIDIGANNVDNCVGPGGVDPTCVSNGIHAAVADLPVILAGLQAADPGVHLRAMNYYDPFLAAWLQGPSGQILAEQSAALSAIFNGALDSVYWAFRARVVDVAGAFQTHNFTVDPLSGLPINVELICGLTWMCSQGNIHANALGYALIAGLFSATIRPL